VEIKRYIKPDVIKIDLDYSITLQMLTQPTDPPPRTDSNGNKSEPFASPFGDKPFG
jgi:hypothetical protein